MEKLDISFVLLTWNSEKDIVACLESVTNTCFNEKLNYEILILDNGSSDSTRRLLKNSMNENENIKCDYLESNSGTTLSRNILLKKVNAEYVFILDADTEIKNGSLLEAIQFLKNNPDIGLIAPKLWLNDHAIQHSVKKFPTLNEKLYKIRKILSLGKYNTSDFYDDFPFSKIQEVDTAISAAWIFPKTILDKVGFLDEKIFYAPEDIDYSLRIWKAGFKIVFYPYFELLHKTQQITHSRPFSKISFSHFKGLFYYFYKHGYWFSRKKIYRKLNISY